MTTFLVLRVPFRIIGVKESGVVYGSIYVFKNMWKKASVKRHFQVKKRMGDKIGRSLQQDLKLNCSFTTFHSSEAFSANKSC